MDGLTEVIVAKLLCYTRRASRLQCGWQVVATDSLGKILIVLGVVIAIVGLLVMLGGRIGLGRLPGDIVYERDNVNIYVPIVTSIVLSIVVTIAINVVFGLFNRR